MNAIFKNELYSNFTGLNAYIFGAFLLLFAGIYTMAYNLSGAYPNFEYVMNSMAFIFLILVPVLTMRIFAEERRQKTDQLLYSLPLSMSEVVLGKFAATVVVFIVPSAIVCLYPIVLSSFGKVYLPAAYSAVIGFFLLGWTLLAIGMFISSLTESQVFAAVLCFIVLLVNYFASSLASMLPTSATASFVAFLVLGAVFALVMFVMTKTYILAFGTAVVIEGGLLAVYMRSPEHLDGAFSQMIKKISLFERFYTFTEGVFDFTGVLYFLTITAVFLFLCVQSLEKRRWS